jgi:hypothetical protein
MTRLRRGQLHDEDLGTPARDATRPALREFRGPDTTVLTPQLLRTVQRQAGNAAAALLVQRGRKQPAVVPSADPADYFAGHFLENHLEPASEEVLAEGKAKMGTKAVRSQGFKKLNERMVGSGWQGGKKQTGTNSVILDYGTQTRQLMKELDAAQATELTSGVPQRWFEFTTTDRFHVVTYSLTGKKTEKARLKLGARYDAGRYKIDHLGGTA